MPILFGLIGLALMAYGVYVGLKGNAAKTWPQVVGRITTARMDTSESTSTDEDGSTTSTTMYQALIEYSYQVGEQQYVGRRIHLVDGKSSSPQGARKALEKYTVGGTAMVYYNPQNPGDACLEPGGMGTAAVIFAAGVFFMVIAIVIANA